MLTELIAFFFAGIAAGIACGLLPGLHVNNVGVMMLSLAGILNFPLVPFSVFLVSMATTQTFIDFIPSIFLGVPDEDTVLSMLPAHKLFLSGRAMEAIRITGLASLYGTIASLSLLPIAFLVVPAAKGLVKEAVVPLLVFVIIFMIMRERKFEKILWAIIVFSVSGYLGYTCFDLLSLSSSQVFLPLFSGMFGVSALLTGIFAKTAKATQDVTVDVTLSEKSLWRNSYLGAVGGLLVGILPAMSPSQIGIMFQEFGDLISGKKKQSGLGEDGDETAMRKFMTIVGSLNTADAMFSIFSLYLIGNPRSGTSVIIENLVGVLSLDLLFLLCGSMLAAGFLAYLAHIRLGLFFCKISNELDLKKLSFFGLVFVFSMVFWGAGPLGILIVLVSTAVGLIPQLTGVSRTHCMGCLILPTLLFYLGL